jgi:hypothetical protein
LGGKMHDGFKVPIAKKTIHARTVGQVERKEPEVRPDTKLPQPGVFQPGVVVVIKVVDANNFEPIGEKPVDEVGADKTGGAGNQNSLISSLLHIFFLSAFFEEMAWGGETGQ